MKRIYRNKWLSFDRMLSDSLWKQFAWVTSVLLVTWVLAYALLSWSGSEWQQFCAGHDIKPWLLPLYLLIDANALNSLYLNSSGGSVHGWMLIVSSITYLVGLLIFNGVIISVLNNYIALRKQNYSLGVSRYLKSGHYIILGYDDMLPSIITHIFQKDKEAYILVLSAVESFKVRERLRKAVPREYFDHIIVNYGHRIAKEYYPDIYLENSKEIYVVGKRSLPDHDAINVECVENIFDYLFPLKGASLPSRIICVFEDFDTYSAFKIAEIFDKAKELNIDFIPYNYYVGWAKKVLVGRYYYAIHGGDKIEYPTLYHKAIGDDDEHYVHLVFVGTSTFAVAFALEATQILHFPNGTLPKPGQKRRKPVKTRVTFIDKNADSEMNLFRTRNRYFFEVQSCIYRECTTTSLTDEAYLPTKFKDKSANFLDIDFEFIKGDVYSTIIQDEISNWAKDEKQYLSVFLAHSNQRDNFCIGMNMPDAVYDNNTPIFIRQDNADTFVTTLRDVHTVSATKDGQIDKRERYYTITDSGDVKVNKRSQHYAHIYPFGMNNTAYFGGDNILRRAQLINYLYETADYDNYKFRDMALLQAQLKSEIFKEAQKYWDRLKVALKWSNLYAAEIIHTKLDSMKAMGADVNHLTDQQMTSMAEVEHNRWNVEKLLFGYRKPDKNEDKYSIPDDGSELSKKQRELLGNNKKYHFIHHDIRPYEELDEVKKLDKEFTKYIPWIISMTS